MIIGGKRIPVAGTTGELSDEVARHLRRTLRAASVLSVALSNLLDVGTTTTGELILATDKTACRETRKNECPHGLVITSVSGWW